MTEWVNSFVIMEKKVPTDSNKIPTDSNSSQGHSMNKKLRICLDPRDLNEALEREPYYTWSIEEIMGKFHGHLQGSLLLISTKDTGWLNWIQNQGNTQ